MSQNRMVQPIKYFTDLFEFLGQPEVYLKLKQNIKSYAPQALAGNIGLMSRFLNDLPREDDQTGFQIVLDSAQEAYDKKEIDHFLLCAVTLAIHNLADVVNNQCHLKKEVCDVFNTVIEENNTDQTPDTLLNKLIKKYGESSILTQLVSGYLLEFIAQPVLLHLQKNDLDGLKVVEFSQKINKFNYDLKNIDSEYIQFLCFTLDHFSKHDNENLKHTALLKWTKCIVQHDFVEVFKEEQAKKILHSIYKKIAETNWKVSYITHSSPYAPLISTTLGVKVTLQGNDKIIHPDILLILDVLQVAGFKQSYDELYFTKTAEVVLVNLREIKNTCNHQVVQEFCNEMIPQLEKDYTLYSKNKKIRDTR